MEQHRTLRVGLTAILLALVFRLFSTDVPEKVAAWLRGPDSAAFFLYLETGRVARFSPSSEAFSPDFMESPPPSLPEPTEPSLPAFSDPEAITLYYASTKKPDIADLLAQPLNWELRGETPTVLILHTHSTESYTKNGEDYEETSAWRTTDESYNMLSIGARLQTHLGEMGIAAIQDRQLHDYPSYNGSYVSSRKAIEEYLSDVPGIRLVLDLHRDASEGNGGQLRTKATVNGEASAQLMLVVGANHDGYEENLSFALKLHAQLESQCPGITRPLQLRAARFNQDLCPAGILVEVGAAGNTHEEAMLAVEELAKAIAALAGGTQ